MGYAYSISDKGAVYFLTCTVNKWVDVFTRKAYSDIIIDSLNFCVANKGLIIYGYVIMSNHVHLLVQARNENLSDVLRDFKKYTSHTVVREINNNTQESRRNWMLWLLKEIDAAGKVSYQFWKPDNHPEMCYQPGFMWQKLNYIHNNPVRAGLVHRAEEYINSSAADYVHGKQVGKVKLVLLDALQTTFS